MQYIRPRYAPQLQRTFWNIEYFDWVYVHHESSVKQPIKMFDNPKASVAIYSYIYYKSRQTTSHPREGERAQHVRGQEELCGPLVPRRRVDDDHRPALGLVVLDSGSWQ